MEGSSDEGSGLRDRQRLNCTVDQNGQTCTVNIVDKAGNQKACVSPVVDNIDRESPIAPDIPNQTGKVGQNFEFQLPE